MLAQAQASSGPHTQVRTLGRPKLILSAPPWGQRLPAGAQSKEQECPKWPQELPARAGVLIRDMLQNAWTNPANNYQL